MENNETVSFILGGLHFEYDPEKQERNLEKHGISFRAAARVFFDENYIGNIESFVGDVRDILYVVYTERIRQEVDGTETDVIRMISARLANDFERGLYYGKI